VTERRNHFEVWSAGVDERLQGLGGDSFDTITASGLRIPTLATPKGKHHRYLFMLCGFQLAENVRATIVGWRTWQTLLGNIPPASIQDPSQLVEETISDPAFRLPDGNISYSLRMLNMDLQNYRFRQAPLPVNISNLSFLMSQTPALLYDTGTTVAGDGFYVTMPSYVPPYGGRVPGDPVFHYSTLHDPRAPWLTNNTWDSLDIPIEGPGFYAMFASVRQSAGNNPIPPVSGLPSEWAFVAATQGKAIYGRVGGALQVVIHETGSQAAGDMVDGLPVVGISR
jgi:hypothetical protein